MRREIILSATAVAALLWSGSTTTSRLQENASDERVILVDTFASVEECAASSGLDQIACAQGGLTALAKHNRFGPKFGTRALCEARYGLGACDTARAGLAIAPTPRPIGFLLCKAEPRGCPRPTFAPIYRSVEGIEFITGDGHVLSLSAHGRRFRVSGLSTAQSSV